MNYLLAISGGVDSVVLLDKFASEQSVDTLVVAHVDHGIRTDSSDDRRFVEGLAQKYGLAFVSTELHLGKNANEELARQKRYEFLFAEAAERRATIVTAHHADDLVGSVAINIYRGTGWRGLGVLARSGVERPLLTWRKQDIYQYALEHRLEWAEDSTNSSQAILRNRLRAAIVALPDEKVNELIELRAAQLDLGQLIDTEITARYKEYGENRYPYTVLAPEVALEILRRYVESRTGIRPTRREAGRLLLAIKTAKQGKVLELEGGVRVHFSLRQFVVQAHLK